jgi:hypothetical protein
VDLTKTKLSLLRASHKSYCNAFIEKNLCQFFKRVKKTNNKKSVVSQRLLSLLQAMNAFACHRSPSIFQSDENIEDVRHYRKRKATTKSFWIMRHRSFKETSLPLLLCRGEFSVISPRLFWRK